MKIRYFADTDTLWIELSDAAIAQTRDLADDTLVDVDAHGQVCAITMEHASSRVDVSGVTYEQFGA